MIKGRLKILSVFTISIFIICSPLVAYSKEIEPISSNSEKERKALIEENKKLQETISSIFPKENKIMYENPYRMYGDMKPKIKTYRLDEVVSKGKNVKFKSLEKDYSYNRPIYTSMWKDFSFRGWLEIPYKVSEGGHRLFIFPIGGSSNFDFEGSLGFNEGVPIDAHRNLNLLIYNFNVEEVKEYRNQVALIGKPTRSGMQVISIVQNDLLPKGVNEDQYLFQLSTPMGYEADFIYYDVINYEYLKEIIKKNSVGTTVEDLQENKTLEQLRTENLKLKGELKYYIPLGNNILITSEICRDNIAELSQGEIENAKKEGKDLKFEFKYRDINYRRPIYDPSWKKNYWLGWAWIPNKICEAMHSVFIIPTDLEEQKNLLGSLSYKESYKNISENEIGILVYNFDVKDISVFENEILINGIPTRTGANVISINMNTLAKGRNYALRLISPDNSEFDYDILKQ
jgi:hypothetical protein